MMDKPVPPIVDEWIGIIHRPHGSHLILQAMAVAMLRMDEDIDGSVREPYDEHAELKWYFDAVEAYRRLAEEETAA